jgi:hypothetical protein
MGPYVFVFLYIYYLLATNPPFFLVYFFGCLLIGGIWFQLFVDGFQLFVDGCIGFSFLFCRGPPCCNVVSFYNAYRMGLFFLWSPLM